MESFFIYTIKASGLIALFFLAYYLFIKKETFFITNRFFLLVGLFTSVLLPVLVYTKIVWIAPAPPVEAIAYNGPVIVQPEHIVQQPTFEINWMYILAGVYCIGVLFFMVRFLIDLYKVTQLLKGKEVKKEGRYLLIDSAPIQSPFSFFGYIVYNSALLHPNELKNILTHEKAHSRQLHSLDMLVSQLFCAFFWFNPFIWLYKKAISQNLEFIADAEATKEIPDIEAYQKTLLKITLQPECIGLTNHFYQSLIKKRIVMLNKQQSKRLNTWKYAIVLPALIAFILLFQIETVAQEKVKPTTEITKGVKTPDVNPLNSKQPIPFKAKTTKAPLAINNDSIGVYKSGTHSIPLLKGALFVMNGKPINTVKDADDFKIPDGERISFLNVLPPKEAKKKYGRKAKKGALEFRTIKEVTNLPPLPPGHVYTLDNDTGEITGTTKLPPIPPTMSFNGILGHTNTNQGMKTDTEEQRNTIREKLKQTRTELQQTRNATEMTTVEKQEYATAMKKAMFENLQESEQKIREKGSEERENQLKINREKLLKKHKELEKERTKLNDESN